MSDVTGQQRGVPRAIGTRWVAKLDDVNYPVTVRTLDSGYKVTFENRKFYITSTWEFGGRLFRCIINEKEYSLQVEKFRDVYNIMFMGSTIKTRLLSPRTAELYKFMKKPKVEAQQNNIVASITGLIKEIKVAVGEKIIKSQSLVVLEAMKMENILISHIDGIVTKINIKEGEITMSGSVLIEIEAENNN